MAMLDHVTFRLAATLLSCTLASGWLLPNRLALAAEEPKDSSKATKSAPSPQAPPATPSSYAQSRRKLEDICRVKGEGQNIFTKDGKLTLALHQQFAGYRAAQNIAEVLNGPQILYQNNSRLVAKALDSANIEVDLPPQYGDDHVAFLSQILSVQSPLPEPHAPPFYSSQPPHYPLTQRQPSPDPFVSEPEWDEATTIKDICRVLGEGVNIFTKDGTIILALRQHRGDYQVAQIVASSLNGPPMTDQNEGKALAKALDQTQIEVSLPPQYRDDPVAFISQILALPLSIPES